MAQKRAKKTKLGYTTFFCIECRHTFNERTGTPFNYLEFPTDIVLLAVIWRLRYKLSLRDIAEMFLERGFPFTHEAIRDWQARFAPLIKDQLRITRQGQAGKAGYVDETYIRVHGKWCYLYRAIDHDGNLVDSMVSEKRNMEAAQAFFKQAVAVVGSGPDQVTTDGHASYPRAIRETMGNNVQHRTSKYLNNRLEQDHRGIKQRYYPMRGFGSTLLLRLRRIAQLSPSSSHHGRSGLFAETTTGFSPASCSATDNDTNSLIGQMSGRRTLP